MSRRNSPRDRFFFFTAQTGVILERPPGFSNYHVYRIAEEHRATVIAALDAAKATSAGLEYPADFLAWLSKHDQPLTRGRS